MTDRNPYDVAVGQIWADNDKRSAGRHIRVIAIEMVFKQAVVRQCDVRGGFISSRVSRIALRRFQSTSTGYRLVETSGEAS